MADQGIEDKSQTDSEMLPELSGEEKASPQEADLLVALRRFVRHEAHQPEPASKMRGWQVPVLLMVVLDMALLYLLFQEWFENPLLLLVLKVLPWLLGATAFTYYSDTIREWILALFQHKGVAAFVTLIALPLLLSRMPAFSMLVSVDSDSATIEPDDTKDKLEVSQPEARLFKIVTPDLLKPYRITVRDPATEHPTDDASGLSKPFSPLLRRPRVVRATLAQIPLIGRLFGQRQIKLAPLYEVPTHSSTEGAHALIEGTFEEGYLEYLLQFPTAKQVCSRRPARSGHDEIWCNVGGGDDALYLPPGKYDFTLIRGKCQQRLGAREIRKEKNDKIDFEKLCSQ